MTERQQNTGGVAADRLRLFIERIERLEEEKKELSDDIKETYAEMKSEGYDVKIVRTIVRLRKMDPAERQEQDAILEVYLAALGESARTPDEAEEKRQLKKLGVRVYA